MQWNGDNNSSPRSPLRSLMEILQAKAEPYVTQYGENQLPGVGGRLYNSTLRSGVEMTPGVGDLLGAEDLQTAAQNNDWGGIGLGLLAAIPGIPAIGRRGQGARVARSDAPLARLGSMLDESATPLVSGSVGQTEAEAALARYRAANPNDTGARVLNPGDEGYPSNAQWDEASQAYVAPRSVEDLVARAEAMGARLDISQGRSGLTLSRIEVPPSARSQGVGSRVMREVESYADSAGLPVGLTPSGDFGGSVPRLNEFYRRFGFTPNSGRSRDFSTRETMLRQPREIAPVEPDYPIRAFHGSPHSFDRFELSDRTIGTGEGAQAYGHGLYFAESEDVARSYRDALQQPALSLGGDIVADNPRLARMAKAYPSADGALQGARDQLARAENTLASSDDDLERMIAEADISEARATIADLEPYAGQWFDKTPTGSMYEVGINAHPDTFLDWDRPMAEQPESVRAALEDVLANVPGVRDNLQPYEIETGPSNGSNLMGAFSEARPADYRTAMTDELRQRGINGIRFLDGNSRSAGEGSSNYVVFNDELVKILRKYGISGLGIGTGSAALLGAELERQGQATEF